MKINKFIKVKVFSDIKDSQGFNNHIKRINLNSITSYENHSEEAEDSTMKNGVLIFFNELISIAHEGMKTRASWCYADTTAEELDKLFQVTDLT